MLPRSSVSGADSTYCPVASRRYSSPCTICTKYNLKISSIATRTKKAAIIRTRNTKLDLIRPYCNSRGIARPIHVCCLRHGCKAELGRCKWSHVGLEREIFFFHARDRTPQSDAFGIGLCPRNDIEYRRTDKIEVGRNKNSEHDEKPLERDALKGTFYGKY